MGIPHIFTFNRIFSDRISVRLYLAIVAVWRRHNRAAKHPSVGYWRVRGGAFFGEQYSIRRRIIHVYASVIETKFVDMFGGLGLHVSEDASTKRQGACISDPNYDIEVSLFLRFKARHTERFLKQKSLSDIRDMASGWQYPGIEASSA